MIVTDGILLSSDPAICGGNPVELICLYSVLLAAMNWQSWL